MPSTTPHHPAFIPPENSLVPLWKYMTFGKFENLLKTGRLYMARADLVAPLYDEFEGTLPEAQYRQWEEDMAVAQTDAERQRILYERDLFDDVARRYRSMYYLMSFCSGAHELVDMWERYAQIRDPNAGLGGVAVTLRFYDLKQTLPHEFTDMGMVRYIDYETERFRTRNLVEAITHKRRDFRNEHEARVVATRPPAGGQEFRERFDQDLRDGPGGVPEGAWRPQVPLSKLIQRVVLQPGASPQLVEAVTKLCQDHGIVAPEASAMDRKPRL